MLLQTYVYYAKLISTLYNNVNISHIFTFAINFNFYNSHITEFWNLSHMRIILIIYSNLQKCTLNVGISITPIIVLEWFQQH